MRSFLICYLLACLVPASTAARAENPPDAAVLFRDEVLSAERKLRWKGPALSDESLFATALSGLSWEPACAGSPLYAQDKSGIAFAPAHVRLAGFQEARAAGRHKIAAPFAFSLALDPGTLDPSPWKSAFEYLDQFGVDFDAALVGVMQAPDKLPLLPHYLYAAMDTLVTRASPRLIPFFLTMAESDDAYLRSRAVAGIGIAAFRPRAGADAQFPGLPIPLKESSISAAQRRIIGEVLARSAEDSNYRVRAAAALALGLAGDESDLRLLERLARDRAYLSIATEQRNARRIVFPVRAQAALALARFSKAADPGGGVLAGKELSRATRGGHDVTRDQSGIRRELLNRVRFHEGSW